MNNFTLAFTVVCPLFLMMALGYVLTRVKLFHEAFLRQLNTVCFQVFLPTILFINVYDSNFSASFQPTLVVYALVSVLAMFALLMFFIPKIETRKDRQGVLVQGIFRSNYILFGLPIASSLYGSTQTGVTAILIAFVIPLFNLLSILALEYFKGEKVNVKRIFFSILSNPLILGAAVAFMFVGFRITMPRIIEQTVRDISKIATPLALIILGGSFSFSKIKGNLKSIAIGVLGKLLLIPLCFISISIMLGFRGVELGALLAMFASPTAVSSYTMAQQMQMDEELAGQIVVIGSLVSILTIFLWITCLSQFGYLNPIF